MRFLPGLRLDRPAIIALLVACSTLICALRFNARQVGSYRDDAHYIVLAESLVTGNGYHLVNYPHPPVEAAFPPGWPLLMAPLAGLFPGHYTVLKLYALLFWLATIPLTYMLFLPRLHSPHLEALVALVAVNPQLIGVSGAVMSEAAYLFFSVLSLVLMQAWTRAGSKHRIWLLILSLLAAVIASAIRTVGLLLLISFALYLLLARRPRDVLLGGGALLLAVLPFAWLAGSGVGTLVLSQSYYRHVLYIVAHLGDYGRFWDRFAVFSGSVVDFLSGGLYVSRVAAPLVPVLLLLVGVLVLATLLGFLVSARRFHVAEIYFTLYVGLFYLWSVYIGYVQPRQLIPLIVLLCGYGMTAVAWLMDRAATSRRDPAAVVLSSVVGSILLLSLVANFQPARELPGDGATDLSIGTSWIRENSPVGSIIMSPDPVADYLYAQRKTMDYPEHQVELMNYIRAHNITYVIVKRNDQTQRAVQPNVLAQARLFPAISANREAFELVYENAQAGVSVYYIVEE